MNTAAETAKRAALIEQLRAIDARLERGYNELRCGNHQAAYAVFHGLWEETCEALLSFADSVDGKLDRGSPAFRAMCMTDALPIAPHLIEVLTGLGLAASTTARWMEAEAAYVESLSYFGTPPDVATSGQRTFLLNGLGDALFFQASFMAAETRYQEAAEAFLAASNSTMAVQALAKSAECRRSLADADGFFACIETAIELARSHGLAELGRSLEERAEVFRSGLSASGEGNVAAKSNDAADVADDSADTHLRAAKELWARGDMAGAKRALREALATPEIASEPRKHFFALIDLADSCAEGTKDRKPADKRKRLEEGIAAAELALAMSDEMLAGELTKIAIKTLVVLLHQSSESPHADRAGRELERLCAMGPNEEAAAALLDRAGHCLDRGEFDAALAAIDRAESHVQSPSWRRIVDLARIAALNKSPGKADVALKKSIAVLGAGGSFYAQNLADERDLTAWRGQLNALESLQGRAAVQLAREGRLAEAFHFVENAKARRLRAVMAAEGAVQCGPSQSIDLEGLVSALRAENAAMAMFWVGGEGILVLMIDPWTAQQQAEFVSIAAVELRSLISTLRDKPLSESQLSALSALLVPALRPVVEACAAHDAVLYLAPDADLFAVPFAALWWDEVADITLAHRCPVAYVPSATLLCWLRKARESLGLRNCLVAVTGATQAAGGGTISFEPQARDVFQLLEMAKFKAAMIVEPSKTEFLSAARKPTIIHLESHGRYDPSERGNLSSSYLAFPGDAMLTAREIADSFAGRTACELVFLNACLSGRFSHRLRGEVAGLWEAFLRAGAVSLIGNLLSVDPSAASAVAQGFYRYWLHEGLPKADALRRAQLDVRKVMPAPELWATHVLVGLA